MTSGERGGQDRVEESIDEDTAAGMRDAGLPTSTTTTTMINKSQSVPDETPINSVTDVVTAPVDRPDNRTTLSPVPPGQCQCSWHGGSQREDPSSRRHPTAVLTVEFAGDSIDEDVTTANNEGPQDTCLSTEEPERVQVFLRYTPNIVYSTVPRARRTSFIDTESLAFLRYDSDPCRPAPETYDCSL